MKTFSVKEKFEKQIVSIWENPNYENLEILSRGFAVQDLIVKDALMFIGINPSYNESSGDKNRFFYNVEQEGSSHFYFNKFKEVAQFTGQKWTHFDLLYFKETKQNFIKELLNKSNGIDFIYNQLEISKNVIYEAKPKILVVSNTKARHFLGFEKNEERTKGVWMDFDFKFDKDFGTYKIINNKELENTPVFFTSMLTGQRAIDKGSFERLKWHIGFVLEKLK